MTSLTEKNKNRSTTKLGFQSIQESGTIGRTMKKKSAMRGYKGHSI